MRTVIVFPACVIASAHSLPPMITSQALSFASISLRSLTHPCHNHPHGRQSLPTRSTPASDSFACRLDMPSVMPLITRLILSLRLHSLTVTTVRLSVCIRFRQVRSHTHNHLPRRSHLQAVTPAGQPFITSRISSFPSRAEPNTQSRNQSRPQEDSPICISHLQSVPSA